MRARTLRRLSAFVLAACGSVAAAACTFTVDLEPLTNEECAGDTKACRDPSDGILKCVSKMEAKFGCSQSNCNPCFRQNATVRCSNAGLCEMLACNGGYRNCNDNENDGCEVNIDFDVNNCGGCGKVCALDNATAICAGGTCRVGTCAAGWANCNGVNTDGCECPHPPDMCDGKSCAPM